MKFPPPGWGIKGKIWRGEGNKKEVGGKNVCGGSLVYHGLTQGQNWGEGRERSHSLSL